MKLKPKDIKPLREQLLKEQNGLCAICLEPLDASQAVLDHCHKTGYIRSVLHRGCNCYIGHMENNLARNKITPARLQAILDNFLIYINSHRLYIHPTHKSKAEKTALAQKRRKRRSKKSTP